MHVMIYFLSFYILTDSFQGCVLGLKEILFFILFFGGMTALFLDFELSEINYDISSLHSSVWYTYAHIGSSSALHSELEQFFSSVQLLLEKLEH